MKNLSDAQVRRLRQRASDHSQKNTFRLVALLRLFKKYNKLGEGKKQRNVGEEEEWFLRASEIFLNKKSNTL